MYVAAYRDEAPPLARGIFSAIPQKCWAYLAGLRMEDVDRLKKSELRCRYRSMRRAMDPDVAGRLSEEVRSRLEALPEFLKSKTVLTYVSSLENEVDTLGLIRDCLGSGRLVLVPVAQPCRRLVWSRVDSLGELAPGTFGVLEPVVTALRPVAPPPEAVAIVPGLVFTPQGHRIGFGGGYYDRFLSTFAGVKVGVAYALQMAPSVPVEPHDVAMDIVVTEETVYRCRSHGRGAP